MFCRRLFVAWGCSLLSVWSVVPVWAQTPGKLALSKSAPPECVFFMTCNGWKEPAPNSTNLTEKLLSEESLKEFVKELGNELNRVIEKQSAGNEQATVVARAVPVLLKAAITHPLAIYLENFTATDPPVINAAAIIDCEADAESVKESLQKLIGLAPKEGPDSVVEEKVSGVTLYRPKELPADAPAIRFGMHKSYLLLTLGEESASTLIKRLDGSGPEPAWLKATTTQLAVDRPSMLLHLDVAAIWKAVDHLMTDPQGRAALEASGLMALKQIACVSGLDKKATQTRVVIETDGPPRGLLDLIPNKSLSLNDFKSIPGNVARASVFRFDLDRVLEAALKIVESADPNGRAQFDAQLEQLEQQLGFSIRKDVLEGFGDTWSFYTSGSEAGAMFIPGVVLTASVRNLEGLSKVQEVVVAQVRAALMAAAPNTPFSINDFTAKGEKGFRIQLHNIPLPIAPTWVLTKDQFVLGINPQLVTSHLGGPGKKSLADHESIKAAFDWEPKPLSVSYSDPKPTLQTVYSLVNSFGPVLTGQLAQRGIEFNIPPLPPISDLEPHLAPSVSTWARTENGWRSESHSVVPSVSLAAPAMALGVGMLLPAVQSAREAARRSQGKNNLKQIGLAMHNHHDAYRAFPPAASVDKKDKPLLSWRVRLLPFIEEQALYDQFHLDEPWDSEHNKALIKKIPTTYVAPGQEQLAKEGKTVYLVPTGEGAAFEGKTGRPIQQFTDGTSNTILAVEAHADAAVIWTKPDDLVLDFKNPLKGLKSARTGGFHALIADGSVRFISDNIDVDVLKALFTRGGGETIPRF